MTSPDPSPVSPAMAATASSKLALQLLLTANNTDPKSQDDTSSKGRLSFKRMNVNSG